VSENARDCVAGICAQEGIAAQDIRPLEGGQLNQVYLVDDAYVVRIGTRPNSFARLADEAERMQRVAGLMPVPRILAMGQYRGRPYQIQQFIQGEKLHHVWRGLSPSERERIMAELSGYLRSLHGLRFAEYGRACGDSVGYASWMAYYESAWQNTLAEIETLDIPIPREILALALDYVQEHRHVLRGAKPVLVHRDLWPGNILVRDGSVVAILDFELSVQAPADYELWLMERFCLYPNDYAEENWEVFSTADFADYLPLLREHYPELFATPHLRERLNLYHLLESLRSYVSWRRSLDPTYTVGPFPLQPVAVLMNVLFEHGTRMFL
jgi:aminoglycoside phosphotransferase (APT) family kinase protein